MYTREQLNDLPWIQHIGTKIVDLVPMTAKEAETVLSRSLYTSNPDCKGPGYLVKYKDGYVSWSPAKVAEEAYNSCTDMNISQAIEALKAGYKVSRLYWDDPTYYLYAVQGTTVSADKLRNEAKQHNPKGCKDILITSHIDLRTPSAIIVGWVPQPPDMFVNDFYIVDGSV